MGSTDLGLFQFDPLLTWCVFMLHPDKTIYGRYGTTTPQTRRDKPDSNNAVTLAGLKAALARALELHQAYQADPKTTAATLADKTGPTPPWPTPAAMPAARRYQRPARITASDTQHCFHCHEVGRATIDSYFIAKRRVPDNALWLYPDPAPTLGLQLSKDHCARVVSVTPGSPAAAAGIHAGDDLLTLAGQPLLSIADIQWVLQNQPDGGGKIAVTLRRAGQDQKLQLTLAKDWRQRGDFGWRYRIAGYAMWLWLGMTLSDAAQGVQVGAAAPAWFKQANQAARSTLKTGDLIVAVDGHRGMNRSQLLAYVMRDKPLGSRLALEILRSGKTQPLTITLPANRPELLGH
jgi:hypothetical protein